MTKDELLLFIEFNNEKEKEGLCSIGRTKSKSERVETDKSN